MISTIVVSGFALAFPVFSVVVHGGASALLILATVLALVTLAFQRPCQPSASIRHLSNTEILLCLSMAAPLAAVVLTQLFHGRIAWNTLDSPSRLLMVVPVFLALRREKEAQLLWCAPSFALGGLAATLVTLPYLREWGMDRFGSYFLNAIHFGDIALIFGVMSLLSIHWPRRDKPLVVALKLVGTAAGLFASLLTGSRGGWIALPLLAVLVLGYRFRANSWKSKLTTAILLVAVAVVPYFVSSFVRDRVDSVTANLRGYTHGNRDTSVGIRLQLWEAGLGEFVQTPWIGVGGNGYKMAMPRLQSEGKLTPLAAVAGEGEMHNQMIAYAVDYGVVGWLALMLAYLGPIVLFHRGMRSDSSVRKRAAMLGLCFVAAFWTFGLTVETFNLKSTVSTYAAIIAILAALVTTPRSGTVPAD